ncbi:MAG: hypothetical protein ACFUZC_22000 [Chthoniobacteraceae bacterium]
MAISTEQIAIWILAALKEEWERDPSLLTCRTEASVLVSLKSKHKINDSDITRGIRFLLQRGMLTAVNRKDGRATLASMCGQEFLEAHMDSKKEQTKADFDRRFRVYAVIVAIIVASISVAAFLRQ